VYARERERCKVRRREYKEEEERFFYYRIFYDATNSLPAILEGVRLPSVGVGWVIGEEVSVAVVPVKEGEDCEKEGRMRRWRTWRSGSAEEGPDSGGLRKNTNSKTMALKVSTFYHGTIRHLYWPQTTVRWIQDFICLDSQTNLRSTPNKTQIKLNLIDSGIVQGMQGPWINKVEKSYP
ncbi:hypothetical protein ACI65C_003070, partial [Semiaphis heraclei]